MSECYSVMNLGGQEEEQTCGGERPPYHTGVSGPLQGAHSLFVRMLRWKGKKYEVSKVYNIL